MYLVCLQGVSLCFVLYIKKLIFFLEYDLKTLTPRYLSFEFAFFLFFLNEIKCVFYLTRIF